MTSSTIRAGISEGILKLKDHDLTDFSGKINITDGGFKVNYLNTNYTIGNETVLITNSKIDASGVKIYDEFKNRLLLPGDLHQRLKISAWMPPFGQPIPYCSKPVKKIIRIIMEHWSARYW